MAWAGRHSGQPGDKICILFGGRVPFILRETSEQVEIGGTNHNCHILLGDSYVHGLMQGEAAKMIERQEVSVQNFYLVWIVSDENYPKGSKLEPIIGFDPTIEPFACTAELPARNSLFGLYGSHRYLLAVAVRTNDSLSCSLMLGYSKSWPIY